MHTEPGLFSKNEQPLDVEWITCGISGRNGSMWADTKVSDMEPCRYGGFSQASAMDLLRGLRDYNPALTVADFCAEYNIRANVADWLNERMGLTQ